MNDFKVTNIIDSNTIEVSPYWQMEYNGHMYSGNKINVRGLEGLGNNEEVVNRLNKILINTEQQLTLDSPELIDYLNTKDAVVSCSIYLGQTNVAYYFSEFFISK